MQDGNQNIQNNGYVFRLHNNGGIQSDWFDSSEITTNDIISIVDDTPPSDDLFITSIPSPFAVMDMIRTSLKIINSGVNGDNYDNLKGETIYHKLVSNMLDIGELFFKFNNYKELLEIKKWNKETGINSLSNGIPSHKLVADTLNLYFEQDKENFNWDNFADIYYLEFRDGTLNNKILGATSPFTLFFPSPNADTIHNLDKIKLTGRILFSKMSNNGDEYYSPLYERDYNFIVYLYHITRRVEGFAELREYIENNVKKLQQSDEKFIQFKNNNENYDNFINLLDDISFTQDNTNYNLYILRNSLSFKQQREIQIRSDFKIKPSRNITGEKLPLVLANIDLPDYNYFNNYKWDTRIYNVPYRCPETNIEDRILPGTQIKYPYLTVDDFLEDTIIKNDELTINSQSFFDGNYNDNHSSVLLPLKPKFFEYFDIEFLKGYIEGEKVIEISKLAGEDIKVILRIPVERGYIKLERTYNVHTTTPNIGRNSNSGAQKRIRFGMAIAPLIKGENIERRVMTIDNERDNLELNRSIELCFYMNSGIQKIEDVETVELERKTNTDMGKKGYSLNKEFDSLELKYGNYSGYIIPLFHRVNENDDIYVFAVDFGTTGTYLSYKRGNNEIQPYEIKRDNSYIQFFHNVPKTSAIYEFFKFYFIPQEIKSESLFYFPTLTALQSLRSQDLRYIPFLDTCISFHYSRLRGLPSLDYTRNLKWSGYVLDRNSREYKNLNSYIRSLLLLIKYKVLSDGGKLKNIKLSWFYPLSMVESRFDVLKEIWINSFKDIINPDYIENTNENDDNSVNLFSVSESLTPFYHYLTDKNINTQNLVLTIDVGGGTTDILAYKNTKPLLASSFRFGARALFGDGYRNARNNNGFFRTYSGENGIVTRLLSSCISERKNDLIELNKDLIRSNISTDQIMEYYFNLSSHNYLNDNDKASLNFQNLLMNSNDGKARIILLFYYSAILYHTFKLIKFSIKDIPERICFSGNGSTLFMGFQNDKLVRFTKHLRNIIFGESTYNLIIYFNNEPKKLTSSGFFNINNINDYSVDRSYNNNSKIKKILLYNEQISTSNEVRISNLKIEDVKKFVLNDVNDFIKTFKNAISDIDITNVFGVSNSRRISEFLNDKDMENKILSYFDIGFENFKKDINDENQSINETMFFYPLVGLINELSSNILIQ